MEIKDTVVQGVEGWSEGSDEFLVFGSALTKAAAAAGLHPVRGARAPRAFAPAHARARAFVRAFLHARALVGPPVSSLRLPPMP
jgi:hypothetical protein